MRLMESEYKVHFWNCLSCCGCNPRPRAL